MSSNGFTSALITALLVVALLAALVMLINALTDPVSNQDIMDKLLEIEELHR